MLWCLIRIEDESILLHVFKLATGRRYTAGVSHKHRKKRYVYSGLVRKIEIMSIYALKACYPVVDPFFDTKSALKSSVKMNDCNGKFSLTAGLVLAVYINFI